jgi:hypothetical protein
LTQVLQQFQPMGMAERLRQFGEAFENCLVASLLGRVVVKRVQISPSIQC